MIADTNFGDKVTEKAGKPLEERCQLQRLEKEEEHGFRFA